MPKKGLAFFVMFVVGGDNCVLFVLFVGFLLCWGCGGVLRCRQTGSGCVAQHTPRLPNFQKARWRARAAPEAQQQQSGVTTKTRRSLRVPQPFKHFPPLFPRPYLVPEAGGSAEKTAPACPSLP